MGTKTLKCLLAGAPLFAMGAHALEVQPDGVHVYPGDEISDAIRIAAARSETKVVKVHAGIYRPSSPRQALIWFHRSYDGVKMEALGDVTLTAVNPQVADKGSTGFPAVVNHVVYFGHGISSNTVMKGFRITGANGYVSRKLTRQIEPDRDLPKNLFFYTDGGAVKVFGRSSPRLLNLLIEDNYTSPCGAGISIQQEGQNEHPVLIENCIFRTNRTQVTGAAIDLLAGSFAIIKNCLFLGNVSNVGEDVVAKISGEPPFTNNGAITIFHNSRAIVENCTFTGNRNAVDDLGGQSVYRHCIFWENSLGLAGGPEVRYDLYLPKGGGVRNCMIQGRVIDPMKVVSLPGSGNILTPAAPDFSLRWVAQRAEYRGLGYRESDASKLSD